MTKMIELRTIAFATFAGCIGLTLLPSLQADTWDKKTTLTVNEPLQVPDCCRAGHTITLQPGDYVMLLKNSLADRHIVEIFDKDQKHLITTILAVPNYRLQPTGKTAFQYWEVPAGQPPALRAWFYPGDNFGQEFAYPKEAAAQIAAFVKTPVPAIAAETNAAEDLATAPIVVVDESGKSTDFVVAAPVVAQAEPAPPVQAEAQAPTPAPVPDTPAPVQETLPHTASPLPLIGLAGLASLVLFVALRRRSGRPGKA